MYFVVYFVVASHRCKKQKIIADSGLPVTTADDLADAAQKAVKAAESK